MSTARGGDADPGKRAAEHALGEIERRCSGLPFHHAGHTRDVLARTDLLLTAFAAGGFAEVDTRRRTLAAIAAAFHDIVRTTSAPQAERESAEEAVAWMRRFGGFAVADEAVVRAAIDATVPSFGTKMDAAMGATSPLGFADGKFRQPALFVPSTGGDPVVSAALALADVATPGLHPPEVYRREGDDRFREGLDARELQRRLDDAGEGEALSGEPGEKARQQMLEWSRIQESFARHLRDRYVDAVLDTIDAAALSAEVFPCFCACIEDARQRAKTREGMDTVALVRDFGFRIAPG